MSSEAQRIAIAEACGWNILEHDLFPEDSPFKWIVLGPTSRPSRAFVMEGDVVSACLPDYLNDLNAMHEAEKVLIDHQCKKYQDVLVAEVIGWSAHENELIAIHATAAQRAEAFLRTINKWTITQPDEI